MSDPRAEHLATRRAAGLFDFSFMGRYEFAASDALEPLQSRKLERLSPGRIAYTLLLNEDGSVFNDATLWRLDAQRWWLFTGRRSDFDWIRARAPARDRSGEHAVLALQGPASGAILARLIGEAAVRALGYFSFRAFFIEKELAACIGRLGYSGELGYELVVAAADAGAAGRALLEAGRAWGLRECSFEAADSLRIESGYVLFGREITGREDPFALGLGRLLERPRRGLAGFSERLVGVEMVQRGPGAGLRPWLPLARVTSECDSPIFGRRLGLGFAACAEARPGTLVRLVDGRLACVARLPFYDPPRRLPRARPL